MIIELLFIAAVGYVIVWCGTHGDPRGGLRQLLRWRPSRRMHTDRRFRGPVPDETAAPAPSDLGPRPVGEPTGQPPVTPRMERVEVTDALTEARWNALIADLDDLADLDLDPD